MPNILYHSRNLHTVLEHCWKDPHIYDKARVCKKCTKKFTNSYSLILHIKLQHVARPKLHTTTSLKALNINSNLPEYMGEVKKVLLDEVNLMSLVGHSSGIGESVQITIGIKLEGNK